MNLLTLILILLFSFSCQKTETNIPVAKQECKLLDGKYPVQNITLLKEQQSYNLIILSAPSCLRMPIHIRDLELARLEKDSKEKAIYEYKNGVSKAYLSQDFSISVTQKGPNGHTQKEVGTWQPFISGALGGVAGGLIGGALANKLLNRRSDTTSIRNSAPSRTPPRQLYQRNTERRKFIKTKRKTPPRRFFRRKR